MESETRLFRRMRESLAHKIPIHHVPPGGNVLRSAVLILEVVGVFPDIQTEQGDAALAYGRILVGRGFELQFLSVEHQPGPPASEYFGRTLGKLLLECGVAPE